MAMLQKVFRTAFSFERSLLLYSSRCMSDVHPHHNPFLTFTHLPPASGNVSRNVFNSYPSNNGSGKSTTSSLLERMDIAILPPSPVERLLKLQLPTLLEHVSLEMPTTKASLDNAHINEKVIEIRTPQRGRIIKQLAIRMLVIRRRKMKKHQRRKFLKKFRIQLMTLAKKRDIMKETIFLSGLEKELKLAESFSAEEYAAEKIRLAFQAMPEKEKLVRPLPWEFQPLFYNSKKSGK